MSARIRLGTQGWSYPDWNGVFYPPGSKQEDRLPFYAEVFDTVELDNTFYAAPKGTIARSWERHTPDGFVFAAKLPRTITHEGRLHEAGEAMADFVRALEPLGDKLGPVLAQTPAEFQRDADSARDLAAFVAAKPAHVKLAVEFRHASWHVPETFEVLRRHNVAAAWTEWRELPRLTEVTADFLYLRWLGDRREIETYDRVQIDRAEEFQSWEAGLLRSLGEVREVYGYFNNHWSGHSPASANEMKRRLGLTVTEPRDEWPQGELF